MHFMKNLEYFEQDTSNRNSFRCLEREKQTVKIKHDNPEMLKNGQNCFLCLKYTFA